LSLAIGRRNTGQDRNFGEEMPGTSGQLGPTSPHSKHSLGNPPSLGHPNLKRVNTPPGLDLFKFMSSDHNISTPREHKRSMSAFGRNPPCPAANGIASAGLTMRPGTSASAMSAMQMGMDSLRSPCFVHKTFGGSIDLERVLDECRAEEMTHHNLLQTATGVREVARQLGMSFIILLIQVVLL
jgi:hypothetical protein